MKPKTLIEAQQTFVTNIALLIDYATKKGWQLTFGEAYRTAEQQAIYVKKGLSKTYNSQHLIRLAVDFNLFVNGYYVTNGLEHLQLGKFWESLHINNRAGAIWGWDQGHFEMKFF